MAFLPEDGTGIAGANSFCAVADADDYFTLHRSASTWAAKSDVQKQTALLEASAWIDAEYRGTWVGPGILVADQGLSWPRIDAYDAESRLISGVPQAVIFAACEMALASFDAPLDAIQDGDTRVKRKKAAVLEVEYETSQARGRSYPFVRKLLSGLTSKTGYAIPLRRV